MGVLICVYTPYLYVCVDECSVRVCVYVYNIYVCMCVTHAIINHLHSTNYVYVFMIEII